MGALLGAGALLLRVIATQLPQATEEIYSRTVFPAIRQLIDLSFSRLPFPTVYLFLAVILGLCVFFFSQIRKKEPNKNKWHYFVRSLLNSAGLLVFLFLVLWGYNYQRIPVYRQLVIEPIPLSQGELLDELTNTHSTLVSLRAKLTDDTLAIEESIPYTVLESNVREETVKVLVRLGFDGRGHPRTKEFVPAGFLRRMGILGIYFPFTGESYIDPTLHHLEKPFTVAHEMAHSFGITDEGEANFISWVVGSGSDDPLLQYAAQLQLLRYQLNDLYRMDRETYSELTPRLDAGIRNDIASILAKAREIQPFSLELTRRSNDLFLKSQGVKAGVKSYAQLPMLAKAWRIKSVGAGS